MKEKMIKQYVRNSKGVPKGVLVAVQQNDGLNVSFGWSLCHKSDQFDKKKGTMIATNRATSSKIVHIPETLEKYMDVFEDRAARYFFPQLSLSV